MKRWVEDLSPLFITPAPISTFPPTPSSLTENLSITAINKIIPVNIHNIYTPPISYCPSNFTPNPHLIINSCDNNIIMRVCLQRPYPCLTLSNNMYAGGGGKGRQSFTNSNLLLLNLDSPTRLPSHGDSTSPDLTVASSHISLDSEWRTLTTLNFNHIPIIVQPGSSFQMKLPEPLYRTITNL